METNRPSSRQNKSYQEPDKQNNVLRKRPPSGGSRHLNNSNSSSLEILGPEETSRKREQFRDHRQPSSAKRGNHAGSVPPRPDSTLTRRTPTPSKQISLQAVRRKEERDDPIVADVDWKELQSQRRNKGRKNDSLTEKFQELDVADKGRIPQEQSSIPFSYSSRHHNCSHHHEERTAETRDREIKETKEVTSDGKSLESKQDGGSEAEGGRMESKQDGGSEAAGGSGEISEDSDTEDEEEKAPNELLMEFVTCLMEKDYPNAQKLCKMILLYEPDNAEALKFQPLIDEKIELDLEEEVAGGADSDDEGADEDGDEEGEDDSDEYSQDDSDDSDSDEDSSGSDSDSDDDDEEEEEEEEQQEDKMDSGIASAAGSVHFDM